LLSFPTRRSSDLGIFIPFQTYMNHMFNNVWCFKFNKRIAFIQFTLQYAERDADINGFTTVPVHDAVENACIIFPAATQDKAMFFQTSFCMTKTHLFSLDVCFQV